MTLKNNKYTPAFMALGVVVILVIIAVVASPKSKSPSTPAKSTQTAKDTNKTTDGCSQLVNAKFLSAQKLEGGLGADGKATQVNWEIDFTDKQFTYQYSDIGETGTYTCSKNAVTFTFKDGRKLKGIYYPSQQGLTFGGVSYKKS